MPVRMSPPLRYPTLVFDLDGTLVDSYEALNDAMNRTLADEGLPPLSPGEVKRYVGEGIERLLERAMKRAPASPVALARFEKYYGEVCCDGSALLDGVGTTLERLRELGVTMVVCTNKPTGFSLRIVEHLGIAKMFDGVAGPDAAGARKPDARHVRFALGLARERNGGALFVGDMPIDVLAARAAGIDVAVLPTGSSSVDELRSAQPDYFLHRFEEIVGVVRGVGVASR